MCYENTARLLLVCTLMNNLGNEEKQLWPEDAMIFPAEQSVADTQHALPKKPLTVIEPRKGWVPVDFRDIWHYRDLLRILTLRDIKVRYKQTLLGAAWAVIQPLLQMIVFTLFFGRLAGMPSDGVPYPIFAYVGLVPWTFFSNAVTNSGNSLIGNSNLVTKVYFPRLIIPIASVASGLLDFAIAFALLALMMIYYRVSPSINMLILPLLIFMTSVLAIGIGAWMSALNVKYRDIRYALPFIVQLGLFATPIIYPVSIVPEGWRWLIALNPLSGQIEAYRAAIFGRTFDWSALAVSVVITTLMFVFAAYNFRKMERSFADVI